ncbi:hypothetical protein SDC9_114981 [bioreactor metagenome]|uniref:Uncharacterized protein n=1 Tax=bioreactor metagenome TaxID=1076179 RepID=A0A645BRV5_9ZZZZ
MLAPAAAAISPSIFTHASRSVVQVLQCTIATASPAGVVTMSISSYTLESAFSSTIIANTLVPALTLPVRGRTLLVATIPVPASPSGGHIGIPASNPPVGSSSFAPASVSLPASSPAVLIFGSISPSFQSYFVESASNFFSISASNCRVVSLSGIMPEASPMPSTRSPVSRQCR